MSYYFAFRPQIKSGDVIAYTHKGVRNFYDFKVWLVRLFTQSEYTHVAVAWCVGERVFLLEAVGAGVRIYPLSLDLPAYHLTGSGLTEDQLNAALAEVGKPYSYWDCVKAYFGANDPKNGMWECAEYVGAVLGLKCHATPSDTVGYLLTNGSTLTEIRP